MLKFDQAYKSLLRGFRKGLKQAFKNSGLAVGIYHWKTERKWMEKSRQFGETLLSRDITDREAAILALLLFPTLGPTKTKQLKSSSLI